MAATPLVNDIHRLSRDLGRLCSLLPGQDPLALFSSKKPAAHFLFEVKVVWCLLARLANDQWSIEPVPRGGRFVYAMSPAAKRNVSYFMIRYGTDSYHLVHGAQIDDAHGEPRAPDISLQSKDGREQPTYEHVLAIWDAKLKGTTGAPTNKRVTDAEFARFAKVREWLRVPRPGDPRDILASWPAAFQVSAIITNGQPPSEPDSVFLECSVSVVKEFQSADSPCVPSRTAHLASAKAKSGSVSTSPYVSTSDTNSH